jgi:transcriptional regulator of nitric oxide reductase
MATAFEAIATVTVGSGGAATIEFTNIPQTYTDLVLKLSARTAAASGSNWSWVAVRLNGATTNASWRQLFGNGSTTGSGSNTNALLAAYATDAAVTANTFSNSETYIPNYTAAVNKSMSNDAVTENNGTSAVNSFLATLWSSTAAVTSITLAQDTGINFAQYSTATLYGIKNS